MVLIYERVQNLKLYVEKCFVTSKFSYKFKFLYNSWYYFITDVWLLNVEIIFYLIFFMIFSYYVYFVNIINVYKTP
jgi:hypothetical protein